MRSQTATTTNNRKRGRESTGVSSSPVRSTRLKTGRHPPPPPRHHSLVTAAALDDLIKVEDDLQTDDELVKMLRRAEDDDPATEDWDEEIISFKKKKKMMMIKKENKNLSPATVIGPPSSLSDGTGPADHDQPTPSKNRKTSLLLLQQQQVANGFPVTVFPPAADNNNSSPPPPSAGPFQQRLNNNSSSKNSSSRANSKPEQKLAVINRHPVKEAPPSLSSSSAAATRRDNNNGDEAATAAVMVAVTSAAASIRRQQMKEAFQPWVMQTYGDAAKTKTISRRKSERIARILRGEDRSNGADSSKFRFWVRAKGFRLGATAGNSDSSSSSSPSSSISSDLMSAAAEPLSATNDPSHDELYVVTSTAKDEMGGEDRPVYKKVAVVEDFFDIIYREHVEFMSNSGGRPPTGKHAGQKRTYRAITEIYAFLPREAVTRFLMQCADCQRRGNGASSVVNPPPSIGPGAVASPATNGLLPSNQGVSPGSPTPPASPHTPANVTTATAAAAPSAAAAKSSHHLPPTPPQSSRHASTTTTTTSSSSSWSQQQLRYLGLGQASPIPPTPSSSLLMGLAVTTNNIDLSLPLTSTLLKRATLAGVSHQQLLGLDRAESSFSSAGASSQYHLPARGMTAGYQMDQQEIKQNSSTPNRMTTSNATDPITLDLSSKTSDVAMCDGDHSPGTVKDEDDEDDDDVDDRIDTQDPERLKAFNMFVRLFVDENLDRMVPISRQPREKIQAIIDSCLRQFPEFGERARKRIRTYLKSCRRHKRTRDDPATPSGVGSGLLSPNRPMPSHLTSVVAEQILAQACENENQNAKRLRLGLDPISQPLPPPNTNEGLANSPTTLNSQPTEAVHSPQSSTATTPTSTTAASPGQITNLFRPAFGPYQRSNSSTNAQPVPINQGPTDLSTKSRQTPAILGPPNGLSNRSSPLQPHKLNAAEILAVRQLVTGYRESAAFLLRSADELEQLLHQQHSPL
ncbi:mucin-19-like [Daphnia pulicaria]|uniref:mucin-19-like n=1 Tax=Daphnia pulicaria TaxID=35523 RepID=UPI001EEA58D2|nr:mucin-19-like [Daphnia pulicaria]